MRIDYGHDILRIEPKSSADLGILPEGPAHIAVLKLK